MPNSTADECVTCPDGLVRALSAEGLTILGRLNWPASDGGVCELALIGDAAGRLWPVFQAALEYADGEPDPLDRWSRRTVGAIAASFGLCVVYPFEGPWYYPFVRWAMASGRVQRSLLGMGLHREYGLWHAYRAALVLTGALPERGVSAPHETALAPACSSCIEQSCLDACPVLAFTPISDRTEAGDPSETQFDPAACLDYLQDAHVPCRKSGCLARNACPYVPDGRYGVEQQRFHLRSFVHLANG